MRYILAVIVTLLLVGAAHAQVTFDLNLDRQPVWGPTGYDHVEYYYLPDIDSYYYVPQRRFYYYEGTRWTSGTALPSRLRGYDFYNSYKVVVNEPTPYRNNAVYKVKYAGYKGRHDQVLIRDSHDAKYFVNPGHPEHKSWAKQQKHGNKHGKK